MSYKKAFWLTSILLVFTIITGSIILYRIHTTLDKVDQYILDDKITRYVKAGWMPLPGYYKKKEKIHSYIKESMKYKTMK